MYARGVEDLTKSFASLVHVIPRRTVYLFT